MADLLTQLLLAEYLDMDARQVRRLEKEGLPTRSVRGEKRYPWPAALHWYLKYKTELAKKSSPAQRLLLANARKAEAQAAMAENELFKQQAFLFTGDVIDREVEEVLRNLRAGLLTFEGRWAPELVNLETTGAVRAKLGPAIEELMRILVRAGDNEDAGSGTDDPGDDEDDEDDDHGEDG
jgi:hypothetical protein